MERVFRWLATAPLLHRLGLLAVIVGSILGYYYFKPYAEAQKRLEDSKNEVQISMMSVDAQRRKLKQTQKAKNELKDIDKKNRELDRRIPGSVDMSKLVGELDQMSDDVKIQEISPLEDDTTSYDTVVIKPITFKIEGKFHSICRFLYKMFQMGRLMDVGDISMEKMVVTGNNPTTAMLNNRGKLKVQFTARIYYSPFTNAITAKNNNKKKGGKSK